jgi:SPOR domain
MRYIISCFVVFFLGIYSVKAQDTLVVAQDTSAVKIVLPPLVDSTLVGISVFSMINNQNGWGGHVVINQPASVAEAFTYYIAGNANKKKSGYRIRIFFDNKQNARWESENLVKSFTDHFPYIPVYRNYTNPYFRVVAGDFRTKSEAMKVLGVIKSQYPGALVIKDQIHFPTL